MTPEQRIALLEAELKKLKEGGRTAAQSVESLTSAMGAFTSTGAKSRTEVGNISTAYKDMQNVLENTNKTLGFFTKGTAALIKHLPGIGPVAATAVQAIGGIGKAFGTLAGAVAEAPRVFITSLDDQTRGLRAFEAEMFDLNKKFGGSIEESKRFADTMRLASDNPLAKSLHLTTNEMAGFVRATKMTSLTHKQLSQTVQTGAGAIELFGAATAFAEASSMDLTTASNILNNLMNKQGKSAQEATNMMGMYVGVAEETGLAIDKVAGSLNSAVSQFAKIGMAADFGKPIMEGFAKTMKGMGLGIEESIGLSQTLTQSLANLTNNYGMAYLTFQRGGLDIGGGGGGGVLGSSIALQSAYLDAEKTGDQAAISDQLVRGMRDTLASLTGGDIVTVQQANEDASLQSQFYIQQNLLKSQFGVSDDNSAARILDMLSQLDEATRTGDVEAQQKLKEQIEKEKQGRDKTLDEMEKVNRNLERQINIMTVDLRNSLDQTRRMAGNTGDAVSQHLIPKAVGTARTAVKAGGATLKTMADWLGLEEGSQAHKLMSSRDDAGWQAFNAAASPMNDVGQIDREEMIGGVRNRGAVSSGTARAILASAMGKDKFTSGGKVLGSEIDRVARTIADSATGDQLQGIQGGRDGLYQQLVQDFRDALKPISVSISLNPEASNAFKTAVNIGDSSNVLNAQ